MTNDPTVYVVDGNAKFCQFVIELAHAQGLRALGYSCPLDYLAQFDVDARGVLVSEIRFPRMSGTSFQTILATKPIHPPLIFATHRPDVATACDLTRNGAVAFLLKPCSEVALLEALERGIQHDQEQRANYVRKRKVLQRFASLTETERRVLVLIVNGHTNAQIAAQLGVSCRTIEDRRVRIKEKLRVDSTSRLIALIVRHEQYFLEASDEWESLGRWDSAASD